MNFLSTELHRDNSILRDDIGSNKIFVYWKSASNVILGTILFLEVARQMLLIIIMSLLSLVMGLTPSGKVLDYFLISSILLRIISRMIICLPKRGRIIVSQSQYSAWFKTRTLNFWAFVCLLVRFNYS